MPTDMPSARVRIAALGSAGACAIGFLVLVRSDVVDDAFITFRAAENAAHGLGATFDPGEPPVESFSSPLSVLLLALGAAAGVPSIVLARVLGLAGLAAAVVATGRIVRAAGGTERSAVVASAATLGSFALVLYAWTGLETTFYAGLLALAVMRWLERPDRADPLAALLLFLAALTRPEAPLVLVALAPIVATHPDRKRALGAAGAIAVGLGLFVAARFAYYGALVPNTFVAKSAGSADHDPSTSAIGASLGHVLEFVRSFGVVLPLAALAAPFRDARVRVVAAPVAAGLVFALYAGGDWMPGARYLAPYAPLAMALGALGLDRLATEGRLRRPDAMRALALACALVGSLDLAATAAIHRHEFPYHVLSSEETVAAATEMRGLLPPHARVVAFRIGALGWAGDFDVIDLLGLADREIARIAASHPDYHPQRTRMGEDVPELRAYVASRDPDAVLLVTDHDATFDPSIELYGSSFAFLRSWPLGVDQAWALYRRERGAP